MIIITHVNIFSEKRRTSDNVQDKVLEILSNKHKKPSMNRYQTWGLWLAKEVEEIEDVAERNKVHHAITTCLLENKS